MLLVYLRICQATSPSATNGNFVAQVVCCGYHTVSIPKLTQQQTFPDIPHRKAVYGAVYYAVQAASNF